jgi:hypothetical protein
MPAFVIYINQKISTYLFLSVFWKVSASKIFELQKLGPVQNILFGKLKEKQQNF